MARYRRLSLMEREELSRMLATGYSLRAAGQALSRAPSTLSRELARQHALPVTYRAVRAHQRAQRWAHQPRKPRTLAVHPRLRTAVFTLLAQRWSPEQMRAGCRSGILTSRRSTTARIAQTLGRGEWLSCAGARHSHLVPGG